MINVTKSDKYAIELLHSRGTSISDIATELKLTESQVKRVINKLPKPEPVVEKPKEEDKPKKQNFMIRHTAGKKNNSVSIMTETASQVSDEFVKKANVKAPDTSKFIFKPNK
jgi:predicted transcriptional regulator